MLPGALSLVSRRLVVPDTLFSPLSFGTTGLACATTYSKDGKRVHGVSVLMFVVNFNTTYRNENDVDHDPKM